MDTKPTYVVANLKLNLFDRQTLLPGQPTSNPELAHRFYNLEIAERLAAVYGAGWGVYSTDSLGM